MCEHIITRVFWPNQTRTICIRSPNVDSTNIEIQKIANMPNNAGAKSEKIRSFVDITNVCLFIIQKTLNKTKDDAPETIKYILLNCFLKRFKTICRSKLPKA